MAREKDRQGFFSPIDFSSDPTCARCRNRFFFRATNEMDRSDAVAKRMARIIERAGALAVVRLTQQQQTTLFAERNDEMRWTVAPPKDTQKPAP